MKINIILEKKDDDFKPHPMYDPKTGKKKIAKKKEDHERLAKKGYVHLDPKIFDTLEKVLEKEGGASGMKPFEKKLPKNTKKEIETALKNMPNVGKHKKGDYILGDEQEIKISEQYIQDIVKEEISTILDEKRKKKRKKKKKKSSGKKDACYHKVKSRYKVWPSAYASGALVRCRKVGAKNWGNKSKKK